jgi:branched-chain amino acid transport system permease protein
MSAPELEGSAAAPPEAAAPTPLERRRQRAWQLVALAWLFRAAVVAGLYALGPLYDGKFFLTFMIDVGIFGLIALGLQHLVGGAGVLNLAQGAFFGLGAYGGVYSLQHWHWTTLPAFGFGALIALAGVIVMAPLLRLRGIYFAMASFAFGAALAEAFGLLTSITGGDNGLYLIPSPRIAGHEFRGYEEYWFLVLTACVVFYVLFALLARSGYGLSLQSVRQSEAGARAAGVNVARMHVIAACLSVLPAAVGGVLYAQIHGIVQSPVFGFDQSVTLLTMVIIGGVLSRWGAFAGAFVALYLSDYTQSLKNYQLLLYGVIIVVLMVVLPDGAAGLVGRLRRLPARLARA